MKRTILTLSLLVLTLSAGAWNKTTYATIMTLASKQLTPEVNSAAQQSLGGEFAAALISDKAVLTFSVDENFAPLRSGEDDALTVVEKSIERLRGNKNDGEAILSLAKAVADLHSVSSLRIKDNLFSNSNYVVRRWNNREGRLARYTNVKWRAMWNSYFPGRHYLFTPEMYAYDIDLYHSRYASKFVEGELSAWVEDVVKEYRAIYAENLVENHILTQERVNEYEYIHDRLLAKAGYRIAALLNQILK